MKLELWMIGKTQDKSIEKLFNDYSQRIKKYIPFAVNIFPAAKGSKNKSVQQYQTEESIKILASLKNNDQLILLDEKGKSLNSISFSKVINAELEKSTGRVIFLIGGAYGFSESLYQRQNKQVALSLMTFTHQMVRLIFIEQLYRAFTIINGQSYHH